MAIIFDKDFVDDLEDEEATIALLNKLGIEVTATRLAAIKALDKDALRALVEDPKFASQSAKEVALIFP